VPRLALALAAAREGWLIVDTNAFIYHHPEPIHTELAGDAWSVEEKRQAILAAAPEMLPFYSGWEQLLETQPRVFVSDAVLDFELSGQRLLRRKLEDLQRRFGRRRLPRGDLVQSYDIARLRKAKNRLLQELDRAHRLSPPLRRQAKGLRRRIEQILFERPLWKGMAKDLGLSLVDRDLALNSLAAATIRPCALLTNDRALQRFLRALGKTLRSPGWSRESGDQELGLLLSKAQVELLSWEREGSALFVSPAR